MNTQIPYRKKLIEVDLPLQAINIESAKDASLTHGHPSTLHRYWARRPLATCRAIIFASMVDDPSECVDEFLTETEQNTERSRLHSIIERLIIWKNSNDENLLAEARYEIAYAVARNNGEDLFAFRERYENDPEAVQQYLCNHCPAVYDPFCGGGSIPLEAQRLGLRARASDLNPLAVLLNKAMIELPPKFHDQNPVNPDADPMGMSTGTGRRRTRVPWKGTSGLANDIRYYGAWIREKAYERIGHLYPKVQLPDGTSATIVAWLWARTIPCANPACGLQMPLMKTFQLSKKKGNEHWVKPVIDRESKTISWIVQADNEGVPKPTVSRANAYCCGCGNAVKLAYVREQARADKIDEIMIAIVAEGDRRKLFLSAAEAAIQTSVSAEPFLPPKGKLPERALGFAVQNYGFTEWYQLFTSRQLTALTTFSDLLKEVRARILEDCAKSEYANTICTYLALAIGRTAESSCSFTWWENLGEKIPPLFSRQAISMIWDFVESNPFSTSTQNWSSQVEWIAKVIENLPASANVGKVYQADVCTTPHAQDMPVIITDPPYYDNIGYADLSDFFYVWLRPLLRDTYPELFAGMVTPRSEEITASPRFEEPMQHFERLLSEAFLQMRRYCSTKFPTSIFYAYKQQEVERERRSSTGWETMLTATINAGFQIVCTWPMRTERTTGIHTEKNALASSIVLVCRPRPDTAPNISMGGFLTALRNEMPPALDKLTREAHIAPVDLAQAAIGPGMEVYSRYKGVKTTRDGKLVDVSVREALIKINEEIDRYHAEQEGEFDSQTRFCLRWFKQSGFTSGDYGSADVLARASDVTIDSMRERVLTAESGRVQLLPLGAYDDNHPNAQLSLLQITTWEACHLMVYHLNPRNEDGRGIEGAVEVGTAMQNNPTSDPVTSVERLARILYSHYDRQGNAENAFLFNTLVTSWNAIEENIRNPQQGHLDLDTGE